MNRSTTKNAWLATLAVAATIALTACGGEEGADTDQSDMDSVAQSACDLTDPETVADVFGGTAKGEKPGPSRNCEYALEGTEVNPLNVFYFGSSDEWDAQRASLEENDGPLTEVSGVGDEAVNPASGGGNYTVVRAGDVIFAVQALSQDLTADYSAEVQDLARRIAEDVG
jgi:hypothetical protein